MADIAELPANPEDVAAMFVPLDPDHTLGLERGRDLTTRAVAGRVTRYRWDGDQVVETMVEYEGAWPEAWARFRETAQEASP